MRVFWIAAFVLLADQASKAAVLNYMYPHQSIALLGDWLRLTFTENPGMAFGITFGPPGTITVLSIIATALVAVYIYQVRDTYPPYRASLSFILGGAIGNIIDRVFYGWLLGYGELFTGRVVDFIHVSLWEGFIPQIVPFFGGAYMELFPIWNVADMAIVLGVVGVLLFHHEFHERLTDQRPPGRPSLQERVLEVSVLDEERYRRAPAPFLDPNRAFMQNGHAAPSIRADKSNDSPASIESVEAPSARQ